jgi:hypothetical protein
MIHNHAYTKKELGDVIAKKGSKISDLARHQLAIWNERRKDEFQNNVKDDFTVANCIFDPYSQLNKRDISWVSPEDFFDVNIKKRGRENDDEDDRVLKIRRLEEPSDDLIDSDVDYQNMWDDEFGGQNF